MIFAQLLLIFPLFVTASQPVLSSPSDLVVARVRHRLRARRLLPRMADARRRARVERLRRPVPSVPPRRLLNSPLATVVRWILRTLGLLPRAVAPRLRTGVDDFVVWFSVSSRGAVSFRTAASHISDALLGRPAGLLFRSPRAPPYS